MARQEAGKLGKGHTFQKKGMKLYCVSCVRTGVEERMRQNKEILKYEREPEREPEIAQFN